MVYIFVHCNCKFPPAQVCMFFTVGSHYKLTKRQNDNSFLTFLSLCLANVNINETESPTVFHVSQGSKRKNRWNENTENFRIF